MTTPPVRLTHEQAAVLRAVANDVWVSGYRYIGDPSIGSPDLTWAIDGVEPQELTPKGKEALAAYDREWVTVRRDLLDTNRGDGTLIDIDALTKRLKELSLCVVDGNFRDFNMRIPAQPERDADLVMSVASAMLTRVKEALEATP